MNPISGNRKRGYLLPMVIIYLIISMIVGLGILTLGSLNRIEANKRLQREQAFYLAEAGINLARFNLKNSSSWQPTNPYPLGAGNFRLVVDNTTSNTMIFVTSTGRINEGKANEVKETTAMTVTKGSGGTFSQGLFGNEDVYLNNNALIDSYDSRLGPYGPSNHGTDGDVASDIQIRLDNNAKVYGDATGGSISQGNNSIISGTVTPNVSHRTPLAPVVIPDDLLNHTPYPVQGDPRITVQAGSYTLSGGVLSLSNNTRITISTSSNGNFRFKQFNTSNNSVVNITGTIRFYIENTFYLANNSQFTLPGGEMYLGTSGQITLENNSIFTNTGTAATFGIYIASTNDQTFSNNSSALSAAIYAPLATINFSNNGAFYGDVVAKEVILSNNAQIHYDVALRDIKPPGDTSSVIPKFVSWTKPNWKIK